MRFTHPVLTAAIAEACTPANDVIVRAMAHNFRCDERLGPARVAAFEEGRYLPANDSWAAVTDAYARYYAEQLEWDGKAPPGHTFQATNDGAGLEHLPDERRELVRLVKIDPALNDAGLTYEDLRNAVDLSKSAVPAAGSAPVEQTRETIGDFIDAWNAYRHRPPAFAGFALDVAEDVEAADWADRLRRRFGLGHLDVPQGAAPISVMMLRYRVDDVLRAAARHVSREMAIRVPTVLESNLYAWFYPSPSPLPLGRSVNLDGGLDTDRLTCEIVHLPVDLRAEHIARVDRLTTPIPGHSLAQVRDDHLEILHYETGREDFGEWLGDAR